MAGRIAIEIHRDGEFIPVTQFVQKAESHETGLILDGETSASPRGLAVHLRPLSPGTRQAFDRIQRNLGWVNPRRFELKPSHENGRLILAGVDEGPLPVGTYEMKVRIGGMKVKPGVFEVDVPATGDVSAIVGERVVRRLVLNRGISDFDEGSRRILSSADSVLDGMPAVHWTEGAKHRDLRKAALLNVLAKLAAIPSPRPSDSLSSAVEHVFFAEIDRIYCAVSSRFHELVAGKLKKDNGPPHPTHKRLYSRIPGGESAYKLVSYRERTRRGSLQAVVAVPRSGAGDRHYVDLDIDGANPGMGLVSFIVHLGEVLNPDVTNHLRLVKKLDRKQVGDFLYYDVARG